MFARIGILAAVWLAAANAAVEIRVTAVDAHMLRLTVAPLDAMGTPLPPADDPALVKRDWPAPLLRLRSTGGERTLKAGRLTVTVTPEPLRFAIRREDGRPVQDLRVDPKTGSFVFSLGDGPVFGLGQGGQPFDRRGKAFEMRADEGGDRPLYGGRMPVPWLMGSPGWALYLHRPRGAVDLTGSEGRFTPWPKENGALLDVFVAAGEPAELLEEYARLTGFPTMPPLWSMGYQQSHRTVPDRETMFSIAKTLREKKLPCDVLIYLGTGFAPSGWNTGHGSFDFNPKLFPNPRRDIQELQAQHFKVILHTVKPPERLDENEARIYWAQHQPASKLGIDGWWPDTGENLDDAARLARIRMYWEGPQLDHPNVRPWALHRTGFAGMQRYGGWLWSGDINSTWDVLRAQVGVGIQVSLSGVPYWGTDIGGFFSTRELTGELFVRWFQFGAFCPLFRAHGRPSTLRFPFSWDKDAYGPIEREEVRNASNLPELAEMRNPKVEPICRKYLELRYRLMPYLYSLVRETHETGVPIMRALWLHYAGDPQAAARGDEYLWGRDMLVAPVTEKGAVSRKLYLPRGVWYDFWSGAKAEGGREIDRAVDLETLPLYVRAGAILPLGPVKQYTAEKSAAPLELTVYPGADGEFTLYEDDGVTFDFTRGEFMKIRCRWNDGARQLTLHLAQGSKMLAPLRRPIEVRLATSGAVRKIEFSGKTVTVKF